MVTTQPKDLEAGNANDTKKVDPKKTNDAKKKGPAKEKGPALPGGLVGGLFLAFGCTTAAVSFYTKDVVDGLENEDGTTSDLNSEQYAGLILGWIAVLITMILFIMAVAGMCNPAPPANKALAAGTGAAAGAGAAVAGMTAAEKERMTKLETQNAGLGRDVSRLTDDNANLRSKLTDAEAAASNSDSADAIKEKQAEIDTLKASVAAKEDELKTSKDAKEAAEKAADNAKAEAEKATAAAAAASSAAVVASSDDAKDDAKIEELTVTVAEKDKTIAERDDEIDGLKRDRTVLKDKVTELNADLSVARADKETAVSALAAATSGNIDDDAKAKKIEYATATYDTLKRYIGVEVTDGPPKGMRISDLRVGGPADDSGIVDEDILLHAGDVEVNDVDDFKGQLKGKAPGDKLPIIVSRDDKEISLVLQLGAKKKEGGDLVAMDDLRRLLRIKDGQVSASDLEWELP